LRPQARDGQRIVDHLYCAAGSPSTVPIAAGYGLKPLIIPQRPYPAYVDELKQWGDVTADAGFEPARPRVSVWFYCAASEAEAREAAAKHMSEFNQSSIANYELTSVACR